MFLFVLFSTIIFLFIAFIASIPTSSGLTVFTAYLQTETQFLASFSLFFLLGFISALMVYIRSQKFDKNFSLLKNYLFAIIQTCISLVVGFFLAFGVLFIIALIELNVLSVLLTAHPNILGIQTDTPTIVNAIKANGSPPEIIASDKNQSKELLAVARATTGVTNYYGRYTLAAIPTMLVIPVAKQNTSFLLLDNTLIITSLDPIALQQISPTLGELFLKQYFWRRSIKSAPRLAIMDRTEYAKYRLNNLNEKVKMIDIDITKLAGYISSLSATITSEKIKYTAYEKIQSEQDHLAEYQQYSAFFKKQRQAIHNQENNLNNELGVFEPKNTIKIALDTNSSHAIADYLETVTHEYLHYASYVSSIQRFSDSFFEEGLTEYFARNIIQKELATTTNLGYPIQVKIIAEMTKTIPESELADIYFTKDEGKLESALDHAYGDGFYENNQILFETLQYTSDHTQAVLLANSIMKKIGGSPLKEKDVFSNYSSL